MNPDVPVWLACESYRAGHHAHWIPCLSTLNKPDVVARTLTGDLVFVEDQLLVVRVEGVGDIWLLHHDPAYVASMPLTKKVGSRDSRVTYNEHYALLRGPNGIGTEISVAPASRGRLTSCSIDDLTDPYNTVLGPSDHDRYARPQRLYS